MEQKRFSIKKVKYDGVPTRSLGYIRYAFSDDKCTLSKQGREMVIDLMKWLIDDYARDNIEIGTLRAEYYFKRYNVDLGVRQSDGRTVYDGSNMGDPCYELMLRIYVPLYEGSFSCTDAHVYRFDGKHGEFEHIDTEVL